MDIIYAKVYVDKTAFSFDRDFLYTVPDEMKDIIKVGMRVAVFFGRGNDIRQAVVCELLYEKNTDKALKPIYKILDNSPIITESDSELINYLCKTTFCSYYDAVKTVLPPGMGFVFKGKFKVIGEISDDISSLFINGELSYETFMKLSPQLSEKVECYIASGEIIKEFNAKQRVIKDTDTVYAAVPGAVSTKKLSAKAQEVLNFLRGRRESAAKEIVYNTNCSPSVIKTLVKNGLVERLEIDSYRDNNESDDYSEVVLSDEQQEVSNKLLSLLYQDKPQSALLFGVTGSGKTNVYIKIIEDAIKNGKKTIVLVPEISLTPQAQAIFKSHFKGLVAVIHSRLSDGERLNQYRLIKENKVSVVVGTRSAVFAPFEKVDLIVVDEEHETSYHSGSSPRYHARDIARFRIGKSGGLLLLCSATPDITSYYHAKSGRTHLLTLKKRYNEMNLPSVTIVDMRDKESEGVYEVGSTLQEKIKQTKANGNQSMILLNRRGYHTGTVCADCNSPFVCPSCSVSLTYHSVNNSHICHYCGHTKTKIEHCPSCGSNKILRKGLGTQKLEDFLSHNLSDYKILRMDADTTITKSSYKEFIENFKNGDYDILIGTQMIAKGHDFTGVSLVGVVSADSFLYQTDYRAAEKAFSMLTQVVGRSGRGDSAGSAIIQTFDPENEILRLAAAQDYEKFYESEIKLRKALVLPPFCNFCLLSFVGADEKLTKQRAEQFCEVLKENINGYDNIPLRVIGPAPASIYKLHDKYRYKILIKCKNNSDFKKFLRETLKIYYDKYSSGSVNVAVDLNNTVEI